MKRAGFLAVFMLMIALGLGAVAAVQPGEELADPQEVFELRLPEAK